MLLVVLQLLAPAPGDRPTATELLARCELLQGKRVLELGCGLGLVSMVLHDRGVDVTASDVHPLAEAFLERNCAINGLSRIPFRRLDWSRSYPDLEPFDVVVASDVLYEDGMVEDIVHFIDAHTSDKARVFVSDPGRSSRRNAFTRQMEAMGWACEEWQFESNVKGRIMTYWRHQTR